jgi:hypothetical protein
MKLIVAIDKSNGMMFNNRRVSQDKEVTSKIIEITKNSRLLMSEYSSKLFTEYENIIVTNNILDANPEDYFFLEDLDIVEENIDELYIFNWNRDYPADKYFEIDLSNYKKESKEDFVGNSHKKITLTIYRRI